eukprot:PITA_25924
MVPENHNDQQPQQQQAFQTLEIGVRRSTRISRPPERYSPSLYYVLLTDSGEPKCYEEAMQVEIMKKWEQAMKEEMNSLAHTQTWDLVRLPADMAGDRDNRRSTIGYVFTVGGTTVNWVSKIQIVIALPTTEVEYVAATEASKEIIWLQRFLNELGKQ